MRLFKDGFFLKGMHFQYYSFTWAFASRGWGYSRHTGEGTIMLISDLIVWSMHSEQGVLLRNMEQMRWMCLRKAFGATQGIKSFWEPMRSNLQLEANSRGKFQGYES